MKINQIKKINELQPKMCQHNMDCIVQNTYIFIGQNMLKKLENAGFFKQFEFFI